MNNQCKTVPVDPDQIHQMAFEEGQPADTGDGYLFTAEEFDLFVDRLLAAAAPVPPAGDVEVVCHAWPKDLVSDGFGHSFTVSESEYPGMVGLVRFDAHDAEVTRLTAENDGLLAEVEQLKRWQATVRENSPLLIQLDALQSELTKARELLKSGSSPSYAHCEAVMDFLKKGNGQ